MRTSNVRSYVLLDLVRTCEKSKLGVDEIRWEHRKVPTSLDGIWVENIESPNKFRWDAVSKLTKQNSPHSSKLIRWCSNICHFFYIRQRAAWDAYHKKFHGKKRKPDLCGKKLKHTPVVLVHALLDLPPDTGHRLLHGQLPRFFRLSCLPPCVVLHDGHALAR